MTNPFDTATQSSEANSINPFDEITGASNEAPTSEASPTVVMLSML